ncbi:unnamed protein product [Dicrocoelium dendriticum]|nr:unnamed protein product [Dicrocoelium dendriticum]
MPASSEGSCTRCCTSFVQWLPVLFLGLVIAWSYYSYLYSLCLVLVTSLALRIVFLVFYHIIIAIFLWCYAKAILEPPVSPPAEFFLRTEDWDSLRGVIGTDVDKKAFLENVIETRNLPVRMVGRDGSINLCLKCGLIKPDRAHHCSTCGKCVLQLDHHCPWTNNCVGFHNHKYFIIFLGWGSIYCIYIAVTSAPYFAEFWTATILSVDRFMVMFLFIVAVMFGLCQLALGGYHCYLVGRNQTTLETYSVPRFRDGSQDPRAFDLGRKSNFQEVFGTNVCLAILPIKTTLGDGIHWRYRSPKSDISLLENGRSSASPLASGF